MRLRAIVFDVDGTLAETERDGHLPACNEAFATLGFPVRWTWEEWKAMLCIPSSALRMRLALQQLSPPLAPPDLEAAVVTLVIEDSEVGLGAAHAAGLPCAVFYNDYTFGQPFAGAALAARSLEPFDLDRLAALCLPEARPAATAQA